MSTFGTVTIDIDELIGTDDRPARGYVTFTPSTRYSPDIDGQATVIRDVIKPLGRDIVRVELLAGIVWTATFSRLGATIDPVSFELEDGQTIDLATITPPDTDALEVTVIYNAGLKADQSDLEAEIDEREQGDAALAMALGGKASASALTAETTARQNADTALQTGLIDLEATVRLSERFQVPALQWPRATARFPLMKSQSGATENLTTPKEWTALANNTGPVRWWGPPSVTTETTGLYAYPGHAITAPWIVFEFITDAPTVFLRGVFTGKATLFIDGEALDRTPVAYAANQYWQITHDYASVPRKFRHFKLVGDNGVRVKSVITDQRDSVLAPTAKSRPRIGWMGDSFSQGMPAVGVEFANIPYVTATLLGAELTMSTDGGTGFGSSTGGGTYSFADRVQDFAGHDLDAFVFFGGINGDISTIAPGVTQTLANARAMFPTIPFFVIGPQAPSGTWEAANASRWPTIQAACASDPNTTWIDTRGWVTGSGRVGAVANNGNADVITSSDGTHPSDADGKPYWGARIADEIVRNW